MCSMAILRRATVALVICVLLHVRTLAQSPVTKGLVTRDTIAKAWKGRQERVRSGRFTWKESETITKGSVSESYAGTGLPAKMWPPGIAGHVIPPEDVTIDVPCSLVLDGIKMRYARDNQEWSDSKKAFEVRPFLTAFDGKVGRVLHLQGFSFAPHPHALTRGTYAHEHGESLVPLITAFRADLPGLREFEIQAFELTSQEVHSEGESLIELQSRRGDYIQVLWVDPSRDFVMRRHVSMNKEALVSKLTSSYRSSPNGIWIPAQWQIDQYDRGKLARSLSSKLAGYEINQPVDPSEFTPELPSGTVVTETKDRKAKRHIVLKNGGKRPILPSENGASYEQLLNSRPGEALGGAQGTGWLSLALPAGVAVVAGLLLWRRHLSRKKSSEGQ